MSCLFCKIVAKEIPATIVAENDQAVAFRDLHPVAPTHVLVVPRKHVEDVNHLEPADAGIYAQMLLLAREVAKADGIDASGYRLVLNTGPDAGQSVFHMHMHVLGGRPMSWPPG